MGKYFGTDGFRGEVGKDLTVMHAYRIGAFLGNSNRRRNKILIAQDTRISGDMLVSSLVAGINSTGSDAYLLTVSTTPSVSYLVIREHYDFGIMVSASHNPYFDNGIKIFGPNGIKISSEFEKEIEEYIDRKENLIQDKDGKDIGTVHFASELKDKYVDFLAGKADKNIDKFNLLVDCANGSTYKLAPALFARLGIKATFINTSPNGVNINDRCGSTNMKSLVGKVKKNGYDLAFAFDGDGDRFLALDKEGNLIDGDLVIYLNAVYMKEQNSLSGDAVVVTQMSNLGLIRILEKNGIKSLRTDVGDKYVQMELEKNGYSLGGEQSGHIIFHDDLLTGDGMLTAVKLLNLYAASPKSVAELNGDYVKYPQENLNVKVVRKKDVMEHQGLLDLIEEKKNIIGDTGRINIRPSGTEPLIRIMVESIDAALCKETAAELAQYIADLGY